MSYVENCPTHGQYHGDYCGECVEATQLEVESLRAQLAGYYVMMQDRHYPLEENIAQAERVRELETAINYTLRELEDPHVPEGKEINDVTAYRRVLERALQSRQAYHPNGEPALASYNEGLQERLKDPEYKKAFEKAVKDEVSEQAHAPGPADRNCPCKGCRAFFANKEQSRCDCESPDGDHYTDCGSQTEACEHCGQEFPNTRELTIHERLCERQPKESEPECSACHGSRRVQVDTWEEDCQRCLKSTPAIEAPKTRCRELNLKPEDVE